MGKLRVISRSDASFANREEAGRLLARELKGFNGQKVVVLGIPRGGILVARQIASVLGAQLDIVLSRKLGAPFNPELAIGAISEDGKVFLNEGIISQVSIAPSYIEEEKAAQLSGIEARMRKYRQAYPKVSLKNKIAVITDDGVATGATMQAALWIAHREEPERLIAALPVGPMDSLLRIAKDADELVCLRAPDFFSAVGQFYLDFDQISDEEVFEILKEEHKKGSKGL